MRLGGLMVSRGARGGSVGGAGHSNLEDLVVGRRPVPDLTRTRHKFHWERWLAVDDGVRLET